MVMSTNSVLRDRLSNLDVALSQLTEEREAVQLQLDLIVYPILTLPPEITSEIFMCCSAHARDGLRMLPSVAPLMLLGVCRAWRTLALSVPALWDTITEVEFRIPKTMDDFITTWFSRAGARPLSLSLIYTGDPDSPHLHSVMKGYASRLQSLDLMTDGNSYSHLADIGPFPILRDLSLVSLDDMLEPNGTPITAFSDASLLRHLSVDSLAPSALLMPWSQLTKFSASLVSLQECLGVMRWATSLCEFHRLASPEEESITHTEQPFMCHSRLTSLDISTTGDDYDILEFLTLPSVQKLKLGGKFASFHSDLDAAVVQFLSRTSATLRTFAVGMSMVPVQWLQITTHLTTLELICPGTSTTDVVRSLDRRNAPDFLPKLQNLAFLECASDKVDMVGLLDVLNSRCTNNDAITETGRAKLDAFRLIWPKYPDSSAESILPLLHLAPLRALASQGMHIHIGTLFQNNFY
ncbi:hypothetical protein C8R44DRAFT_811147 [Mycena epipterygia]|nr:hypothetical protein C8R44DRAFT_811147 [Mycena epipterygia]